MIYQCTGCWRWIHSGPTCWPTGRGDCQSQHDLTASNYECCSRCWPVIRKLFMLCLWHLQTRSALSLSEMGVDAFYDMSVEQLYRSSFFKETHSATPRKVCHPIIRHGAYSFCIWHLKKNPPLNSFGDIWNFSKYQTGEFDAKANAQC